MTRESPRPFRLLSVDLPVVFALAVVPVIWPTLLSIGPTTIEPFHLAVLLVVGVTLCQPRCLIAAVAIVRDNIVFVAFFTLYLFLLSVSFLHSMEGSAFRELIVKQSAFAAFAACIAARVASMPDAGRTLYVGGIAGLLAFFAVLSLSAQAAGVGLLDALVSLGQSGDYKAWVYKFLKPALSSFAAPVVGNAEEIAAARKNNIASGLLVCLLCYIIGHVSRRTAVSRQFLHYSLLGLFLASLLMMLSRSVMLSLILSVLPIVAVKILRGRDPLFIVAAFATATSLMLAYLLVPQGIIDGLAARFFDDTTSFESRLSSYSEAFKVIEQNLVYGVGLGGRIDEKTVHNLFLYAWLQAGVLAFLVIFVAWSYLVFRVLEHLWRLLVDNTWTTRGEITLHAWIAALPIMALMRVWVSGGGTLNFAAWLSIGVFLGLLARHRRPSPVPRRLPAADPSPAPTGLGQRQDLSR